ncbi:sensor histidine kinase [Pontiella sp.]|uniref:sensor histidine kinase n=1 Tax=Pontiella sp. TaxID=2837462 RepID=UPI0035696642
MRLKQWNSLRRTFRFRLAVRHVQLMFLVFVVAFVASYYGVKSYVVGEVERELVNAAQQMNGDYLGERIPHDGLQLPESLLQVIESEFPGLHIGLVEMEDLPDGWVYEVIGSTGSEQLEIFAAPPDRTMVAQRKPMSAIFHDMEASLLLDPTSNLDLLIFSPAGVLLAGGPPTGYAADWISSEINWADVSYGEPQVFHLDDLWLAAVELFDGNHVCIIDPANRVALVSRSLFHFFSVLILLFLPLSGWVGFDISRRAMAGVERVSATANRVKSGHLDARVVSGNEGSEIEKLAADFNGMVERVESLMRELQDVTVNIAHDLKTPLSRIRGLLESLGWQEVSPDERSRAVAAAMEECDRVAPLIDSIIELARVEAGMVMLQNESFDLAAEVRTAHAMFSALAEDKHIDFSCRVPDSHPMTGDRRRMQRVIANLVDNALKFTPEGGTVEVALMAEAGQSLLTVRDSGPGIPAEDLPRVFERFYRADGSRTTEGHGLGLSLVNAFVKAMNGSVKIESAAGGGCVVKVRVPQESP